jgi:hypothetical protein
VKLIATLIFALFSAGHSVLHLPSAWQEQAANLAAGKPSAEQTLSISAPMAFNPTKPWGSEPANASPFTICWPPC